MNGPPASPRPTYQRLDVSEAMTHVAMEDSSCAASPNSDHSQMDFEILSRRKPRALRDRAARGFSRRLNLR